MRVLVVDDNPVMRAGLKAMLGTVEEVHEVVELSNGRQALEYVGNTNELIDLVFLDIRMPGMDGLAVLKQLDGLPTVMLTGSDDEDTIREAMEAGARGYLVNGEFTEVELMAALHLCPRGGTVLSPTAAARASGEPLPEDDRFGFTDRERALVQALAEGLSNHQIARRMFLSEKTVKNHLGRVYSKMGVASRSEAIVAWLKRR
jgi:DNA-binding NarL/FixJ family response regulator